MNADEFRDYILGFIFYKYLSEKMDLYANNILKPDGIQSTSIDENGNIYFAGGASFVKVEILERLTSTYEPDSKIKIDLFPNPTNGLPKIDTESDIYAISVFSINGELLQTVNGNQPVIDISNLETGIYFVKVTSSHGILVQKIIKGN